MRFTSVPEACKTWLIFCILLNTLASLPSCGCRRRGAIPQSATTEEKLVVFINHIGEAARRQLVLVMFFSNHDPSTVPERAEDPGPPAFQRSGIYFVPVGASGPGPSFPSESYLAGTEISR